MPSGVMDSGLIKSRQEVKAVTREKEGAPDPSLSPDFHVVWVSVPLPGPDWLGAGSGWVPLSLCQQREALRWSWCSVVALALSGAGLAAAGQP